MTLSEAAMAQIIALFKPPRFEDEEKTRQAFLLHVILWAFIVVPILLFVYTLFFFRAVPRFVLTQVLVGIMASAFLLILMRRGYVRSASIIQIAALWGFFTATAWTLAGIHHQAYQIGYAVVISIAGFLVGMRGALIMVGLSLLSGWLMVTVADMGLWSFKAPEQALQIWVVSAILFPVLAVLQYLAGRLLRMALAESQMSQAQYRLLADHMKDQVWLMDLNLKPTYISPSVEKSRGYTFEEIKKLPLDKHLTATSFQSAMEFFSIEMPKALADSTYFLTRSLELEFYRKDGSTLWVESQFSLIRDENGKPLSLLGVGRDITERKQAEEEARERLLMLESVPSGIVVHDAEGNFLYANQRTFDMHGYSRDEFMDLNLRRITESTSEKLIAERMQGLLDRGEAAFEVEHLKKNGAILPLWVNVKKATWGGKSVFLSVETDITERKRADHVLRESEQRFRELAELLPEIVFETDIQGTLTFVNRNAFDRFGYTQEDFAGGLNALNMVIPDDRGRAENILRVMNEEAIDSNEFTMQRKDGSTFPSTIHSTTIIHDGKPVGLRGVIINITERKRAEEENRILQERLQRSEKMEALGTLAGGVAHDLNNVLGIVVGYAELILMNADESSSIRPHLVNIMSGGMKAAAIVDDLLTLARRGVSGRDVLNLNKIIADCQQSPEFEKLYSFHPAVKIKTDLEADLPNISGSSVHFVKSLYNLVSNASEAMTKGGIVTIKTSNQYLDKPIQGYDHIQEGDYVVLSVSDTGEGIHEVDLKRIFEPFYTKKVMGRSGTGLGLAVVWGTVKDHHGYINVQSEKSKGSTFTLYFPVSREDITAEHVAASVSEYMGKGESILVVDDVKEQRDLASGMLRTLNYSVTSVSSGEDAVAYIKEHEVDLMVLDMIMDPGMDGLDTYRSVLAIHPKQKAIIVSGFSESDRVKSAKNLGAGAYVRKPYVIEKLGLPVRKELDCSA
jgi:two-component system cell cycle sensor histidine kinase/response regulator CckA